MRFIALVILAGCVTQPGDPDPGPGDPGPGDPQPGDPGDPQSGPLTADQRRRADQLISVFENDTIEIQYDYIENLDDGRGYTAGRSGFTTANGDLLDVAERYTLEKPGSAFAEFLPRLREVAAAESDSTSGLAGLPAAWTTASSDPSFRAAQDAVTDDLYFLPAVAIWRAQSLTTPLALAELYDAITQHGEGDDPDGLPAMIDRTADAADERTWLTNFLAVRRATLEHASDPETRDEWAQSVDRVDAVSTLLAAGKLSLDGPIVIDTPDHHAEIP